MNIKTLSRADAQTAMNDWLAMYPMLPKIDNEYMIIRKDLQNYDEKVRNEAIEKEKKEYYQDVHFGLFLYEYLLKQPGFNMRTAANDDFWRYLSIKVVPDLVAKRWGKDNDAHYWSKPARIYLRCIWWYIHLSWQGDVEKTMKVLDSPCFSTDSILNLVERTGRKGTYIGVYRCIMYYYSKLSLEEIERFNKSDAISKGKKEDLFRVIMKLHTAKVMVMEPELYPGGEMEYVKSLFRDVGVRV